MVGVVRLLVGLAVAVLLGVVMVVVDLVGWMWRGSALVA